MTDYEDVLNALERNNLHFSDVDRIELRQKAHDEWKERGDPSKVADHHTRNTPSVRVTTKEERVVYVDSTGRERIVEL